MPISAGTMRSVSKYHWDHSARSSIEEALVLTHKTVQLFIRTPPPRRVYQFFRVPWSSPRGSLHDKLTCARILRPRSKQNHIQSDDTVEAVLPKTKHMLQSKIGFGIEKQCSDIRRRVMSSQTTSERSGQPKPGPPRYALPNPNARSAPR